MSIDLLSSNKRFQDDITRYKTAIESVKDNKAKSKGEKLLKDFLYQAHLIDEAHSFKNLGFMDPKSTSENSDLLIQLKSKLEKFTSDCNQA